MGVEEVKPWHWDRFSLILQEQPHGMAAVAGEAPAPTSRGQTRQRGDPRAMPTRNRSE